MHGFSSPTLTNSLIPARCPTIQIILTLPTQNNHQTDPLSQGISPTRLSPLQMPITSLDLLYFWPPRYKSGIPTTPFSCLTICLSGSQNSGKYFHYYYPFNIYIYIEPPAKETGKIWGKVWRASIFSPGVPLSQESQKLSKILHLEFVRSLSYLRMVD